MAMFSAFKKGVKQAKELKAAEAEAKKKEESKVPYKHVPTHAATDALTSAPAWREDDRPKIFEANRRRSTMPGNNYDYLAPKSSSSLSTMSYPVENANPVVRLPRAVSYSGYPTNQANRFAWQTATDPNSISRKGKEVERPLMYGPGRGTSMSLPTRERPGPSPLGSSSESASSGDEMDAMEMKPRVRQSMVNQSCPPITGSPTGSHRSSGEQAPRLTPRNPRRLSNASIERGPVGILKNPVVHNMPYSGVPPMPAMPPAQLGPQSGSLPSTVASSSASLASIPSTGYFSSAPMSSASTPISHSAHSSITTKPSFIPGAVRTAQYPAEPAEPVSPASSSSNSPTLNGDAMSTRTARYNDTTVPERRVQKQTRFAEHQPDESETGKFQFGFTYQDTRRSDMPPPPSNSDINFAFTEPIALAPATEIPAPKPAPVRIYEAPPPAPIVPATVVAAVAPQQAPVVELDPKAAKKLAKRSIGSKLLKKNRMSKVATVAG